MLKMARRNIISKCIFRIRKKISFHFGANIQGVPEEKVEVAYIFLFFYATLFFFDQFKKLYRKIRTSFVFVVFLSIVITAVGR